MKTSLTKSCLFHLKCRNVIPDPRSCIKPLKRRQSLARRCIHLPDQPTFSCDTNPTQLVFHTRVAPKRFRFHASQLYTKVIVWSYFTGKVIHHIVGRRVPNSEASLCFGWNHVVHVQSEKVPCMIVHSNKHRLKAHRQCTHWKLISTSDAEWDTTNKRQEIQQNMLK